MSKLEFNKEKIIDSLKEVIDADQILNINNFSDEILIELITCLLYTSPSPRD